MAALFLYNFPPLPANPGSSAGLLAFLVQSRLLEPGPCSEVKPQEAGCGVHCVGQGAQAGCLVRRAQKPVFNTGREARGWGHEACCGWGTGVVIARDQKQAFGVAVVEYLHGVCT